MLFYKYEVNIMTKDIKFLIQSYYPHLSGTSKHIADYLLQHPQIDSSLTISALAQQTGTSIASISRFAKMLGFKNFQDFKLSLLTWVKNQERPLSDTPFQEINTQDSLMTMTQKIFTGNTATLDATLKVLTEAQLKKAIRIIQQHCGIALFGLGASSVVAQDGYHKFLRSNKVPLFTNDFHMQLMMATKLTPEHDCAIIISHSGENRDILTLAKKLRENKIPTICITSYGNASLTKLADVTLLSIADETNYQDEALHAVISQISLIDTLFILSAVQDSVHTTTVFKEIRATIDQTRNK